MKELPISVRITQVLLLIEALMWLILGVIILLGLHPALPEGGLYRWGIGGISILAAVVLVVLARLLRKRVRPAWYLTMLALFATFLVILFDNVGWVDLAVMAAVFLPMILLLIDRDWYLGRKA
ncbi:MAG TPA: hypothetical protein PK040_00140 [Anaerolineaceae bacterium]|nr:hypothetical protein [Anaerolineaceae bacterium]